MPTHPHYLLILACSNRKRSDPGLLPALDRYDGGSYRLLHKAQREGYLSPNLTIMILSAQYGLIESDLPIPDYNLKMDHTRAAYLHAQVLAELARIAGGVQYDEVYIDMGNDYLPALEGIKELFPTSHLLYAHGRIGERLARLKAWVQSLDTSSDLQRDDTSFLATVGATEVAR